MLGIERLFQKTLDLFFKEMHVTMKKVKDTVCLTVFGLCKCEILTLSVPCSCIVKFSNLSPYFSLNKFERSLLFIFSSLLCLINPHFLITKCLILYVLCKDKPRSKLDWLISSVKAVGCEIKIRKVKQTTHGEQRNCKTYRTDVRLGDLSCTNILLYFWDPW